MTTNENINVKKVKKRGKRGSGLKSGFNSLTGGVGGVSGGGTTTTTSGGTTSGTSGHNTTTTSGGTSGHNDGHNDNNVFGWSIDTSMNMSGTTDHDNTTHSVTTTHNTTQNEKKTFKKTRRGGGGGGGVKSVLSVKSDDGLKKKNTMNMDTTMNNTMDNDIDFVGGHINSTTTTTTTGQKIISAADLFLDQESQSYFMALEPVLDKICKDAKLFSTSASTSSSASAKILTEDQEEEWHQNQLLINNLFEQELCNFSTHEKQAILCDFATSRVLQKILDSPLTTKAHVKSLCLQLVNIAPDNDVFFASLVCHQFASHVFQSILEKAGGMVEAEMLATTTTTLESDDAHKVEKDENDEKASLESMSMQDFIAKLTNRCMDKWSDFMIHPHGTHILRSLLNLLAGGAFLDKQASRSKKSRDYNLNHDLSFVRLSLSFFLHLYLY